MITEDNYIDYLSGGDIGALIPIALWQRMTSNSFLFLGYSLSDWNLRVILHRLWGDQPLSYRSWAVQPEAKPLEREFWRRRDVEVVELPFEDYAETLGRFVAAQPAGADA